MLFKLIRIKGGTHKSKSSTSMLLQVNNNGLKQVWGKPSTNNGTLKTMSWDEMDY